MHLFRIYLLFTIMLIPTFVEAASRSQKKEMSPSKECERVLKYFSMTGPRGWNFVDDKTQLPGKIALIFVGEGKGGFTPSINVAMEETDMQISEYVKLAKEYHTDQTGTVCQSMGQVQTRSGMAEVLQIERGTQWGDVRFIQASLIQNGKAYVITATCLTEEFSQLAPHFFKSIQSFKASDFQ